MKIMHIIYTLVSNALKYTIRGSISLDCTIEYSELEALITITDADTGAGMNS